MSDTLTLPPPAVLERKCSIEEVFDTSFIELLKLVPANPYVRALILKFTGKLPPTECELFEPLKDWVERNCVKRIRKTAAPRQTEERGIIVQVDFTDTEFGRVNYSVQRSGRGGFQVGADDLLEIIQDTLGDGGGIGEVVQVIVGRIEDDAWNECDPDMEDSGEFDYNDHDANDTGDGSIDFSKDEIRNAVLQFVRERHPELAAEL
jgi:hypothetical protein